MTYHAKFNKNGNIKLGHMWTFNKLAGSGSLCGCRGTCGAVCEKCKCYNPDHPEKSPCYVFKSYVRYGWEKSTVVKSHVRNTCAIRSDISGTFADLEAQITRARYKPEVIRVHSSGEIEDDIELIMWAVLAIRNTNIKFYIYTKNYDILDYFLSNLDSELPPNFIILISVWHEYGLHEFYRWQHLPNIKAFVYDDGEVALKVGKYCPAYDENGKMNHNATCQKCKLCFNSNCKVIGCKAH